MVTMCTEEFMRGSRVKRMLSHALGRIWSWRALGCPSTSLENYFKHLYVIKPSVFILVIKL